MMPDICENNELWITNVISKFPSRIKPRDYLMAKLSISRESAYRRIKGTVPFSFDEILQISQDLGFSLDEIAGKKDVNKPDFSSPEEVPNPEENALQIEFIYKQMEFINRQIELLSKQIEFVYKQMDYTDSVSAK
jgi:hypothetical protein